MNEKCPVTSLHYAVSCGDVEAVERQLSNGVDVDAVNKDEEIFTDYNMFGTPLFFAAREGATRIVQILLDHKADINSKLNTLSPLSIAITRGHEEVVKLLLNRGADVTVKDNMLGNTPLHLALYYMYEDIATEIFQKFVAIINSKSDGGTVDVENNLGETPLYYAALKGLNKFVKVLLDNKADANYKTKYLQTPFEIAVISCNVDTIATFLELVDINILINYEIKKPDNKLFSDCQKVQNTILRHIIKRKVAGFYLNKYILAHRSFYEQNPFHRKCEKEIEWMQDKIKGLPVSLYDILLNDSVKSCYFKNQNLSNIFETGLYEWQLPIYASELERKCGPGVRRQKLLREGSQALISLLSGVTKLPELCSGKTVSYLDNADLENLINACNSSSEIH